MRMKVDGGLLRIASAGTDAANEDPAAERVVPVEKHREESTAGWDPYEVWRTRVKQPRVARDEAEISEPHDHG